VSGENVITQFFLRPIEKTKQEVRQTNDQAPQSYDKAYDESDDGLYKVPNLLEDAFDLMRNGGPEAHASPPISIDTRNDLTGRLTQVSSK
jgi:hypothetical protein